MAIKIVSCGQLNNKEYSIAWKIIENERGGVAFAYGEEGDDNEVVWAVANREWQCSIFHVTGEKCRHCGE